MFLYAGFHGSLVVENKTRNSSSDGDEIVIPNVDSFAAKLKYVS